LPVFTVNNAEEAKALIALACPTNLDGEYISPELAQEQTLERLNAFGDRLDRLYRQWINNEEKGK
jgi:hypothetical protein